PHSSWTEARPIVSAVSDSADLQIETPLFSKTLRPGVGLAEDPQTGVSFGMHRSWLVARSMVKSYFANRQTDDLLWSDLCDEFEVEHLSIERAYLNAGSVDVYEI